MLDLGNEIRHASRRLRRAPAFSVTALLILAVGIGATTVVFSIVNGILLRPLPFPESDRLLALSHTLTAQGVDVPRVEQSDASFLLYQRHATLLDGVAAYRDGDVNLETVAGGSARAERVTATGVSANLFPVLGVAPLRGRGFRPGEDRKDAPRVVVISEALWRRAFGGDPSILGRRISMDGSASEVVGIMSARFQYPSTSTAVWYPIHFDVSQADAGSFNYSAIGRLKPGVTTRAAVAELRQIIPRLLDEFPSGIPRAMWEQAHVTPVVRPLRDAVVGDVGQLLWILLGSVGLLLLIACANVANLFLVRGEGRHRELALRTALGAGAGAILAQYLGEAMLLALAGGLAGVGMAFAAVRLLGALPAGIDLPRLTEVSIDATVLGFAVSVTMFSALAVSLLPLLRARRVPIVAVLKESGRSATIGAERQRARSALVVAQVALAVVLVAASGLMARSFLRLRGVQPGFDAAGVLTLRLGLPNARYAGALPRLQLYERLLAAVGELLGVRRAAITTWVPLTGNNDNSVTTIEDHPLPPNAVPRAHDLLYATNDYFMTMGIPLLAGRIFDTRDPSRPSGEVVVSHAFADRYWKNGSAIGKRLHIGIDASAPDPSAHWNTIVGVVGDVHLHALEQPAEEAIYFPVVYWDDKGAVSAPSNVALVIRTAGDPVALSASLRRLVQRLDPALPTYGERPMSSIVRSALARTRFTLLLLAVASGIALALGAVGIYGVMAYGVSLRQREIGVRMALGARPSQITRMISRQGVALGVAGTVAGLIGAIVLMRLLRGLLYDISPTDPLTLGGTCCVLLLVSLVASWLPGRRAAGIDPAEALRSD